MEIISSVYKEKFERHLSSLKRLKRIFIQLKCFSKKETREIFSLARLPAWPAVSQLPHRKLMNNSKSPFLQTILDHNPNCFFKGPREGSPLACLPARLAISQLPLRKLMSET